MLYPPISELTKKMDRYSLVILTAKRARKIKSGEEAMTNVKSENPVTLAVNEIYEGKVIPVIQEIEDSNDNKSGNSEKIKDNE